MAVESFAISAIPCPLTVIAKIAVFSFLDWFSTVLAVRSFGPEIEDNIIARKFIKNKNAQSYFIIQFIVFSVAFGFAAHFVDCGLAHLLANLLFLVIVWNFFNFAYGHYLLRRRRR
ncbi:hypothetical protein ACWCOP_06440 [Maricaulaceae bacterium MS644]